METKELERRIVSFLEQRGSSFAVSSITYRGIMQDAELPDGTKKDMHMFAYQGWGGENQPRRICYIFADVQTHRLELLITPHTYEIISEEGE